MIIINPAKNLIIIDDRALTVDCSGLDQTIHVIQWNGTRGVVEYKNDHLTSNGDNYLANIYFDDVSPYQSLIDAWQAARDLDDLPKPPPSAPPELTAMRARIAQFSADSERQLLVEHLKHSTPAQIKTFVTANVTDLASARQMLIKLALAMALIVRN